MAIDMKTVKEIEFNNKQVKKIEDSNGNILWQKQGGQTVTITFNAGLWWFCSTSNGPTYSSYRYSTYNQLTDRTATATTTMSGNTDYFFFLDATTAQNIVNKTYTSDTTIPAKSSGYICYIKNNELWFVGNTDNVSTSASVGILDTTNDITKAPTFYFAHYQYSLALYYDYLKSSTTGYSVGNAYASSTYGYDLKWYSGTAGRSGIYTGNPVQLTYTI